MYYYLNLSRKITLLIMVTLIITSCGYKLVKSASPTLIPKAEIAGSLLHYSESQLGEKESDIRVLVTKDILRIDAGPKSQNYRLYDRRQKKLYDVNADDRSVKVINITHNTSEPDFVLNWTVESQASHAVMRNTTQNSSGAIHHQFKLNQQACYDTVAVDSVIDDVRNAMTEYYLAVANSKTPDATLKESQACKVAIEIFSPANHLKAGFPIREWSAYGFQRFLIDYREHVILPRELFILPADFSRIIQE